MSFGCARTARAAPSRLRLSPSPTATLVLSGAEERVLQCPRGGGVVLSSPLGGITGQGLAAGRAGKGARVP